LQKKTYHIPPGTTIRKSFKKGTLNGKISSYDKEREYYMIEYEDGDSEELRHKTVERYIITADTDEVPLEPVFFEHVAEVRDSPKSLKFFKN
jgi:hypothetical protein